MALPTHRAKETIASTPNTSREPWLVLAPKNEPAIGAAASTVQARALKPESARSCSASALAVNSKLSCSIRFGPLLEVYGAAERTPEGGWTATLPARVTAARLSF